MNFKLLVTITILAVALAMTGCNKPGQDGLNGPTGEKGDTGSGGDKGDKGDQGSPGQDGATGPSGSTGATGATGNTGGAGLQGPPGADGTAIVIVNLCPGATTYSSTFVEIAMCINNELYGVYSANGGFMTKFPPGNYSSNAIGSACNLTVNANCVVTH